MDKINSIIAEKGIVYLISQIISAVATLFLLFSFQRKNHRSILLMQAVSGMLFGIQYMMIGAPSGAICNFVGMARSFTYSFRTRSKIVDHIACPIFFSIAFACCGIFTVNSLFSILPICAMIISSFVTWNPKTQQLRALTLPTSVMWLIYNASCGSLVAVITELSSEVSIIIGLIRFRKRK